MLYENLQTLDISQDLSFWLAFKLIFCKFTKMVQNLFFPLNMAKFQRLNVQKLEAKLFQSFRFWTCSNDVSNLFLELYRFFPVSKFFTVFVAYFTSSLKQEQCLTPFEKGLKTFSHTIFLLWLKLGLFFLRANLDNYCNKILLISNNIFSR